MDIDIHLALIYYLFYYIKQNAKYLLIAFTFILLCESEKM